MKTTLLSAALLGFGASVQAQDYKWQAFYTQTYETVQAIGDVWVSGNQGGLRLVEEENGNHYMLFDNGDQNSRSLHNLDVLTADMYEGIDEYRLEFDLALTPGNKDNTQFAVGSGDLNAISGDWITPGADINKDTNKGPGSGVLLYLFQMGANSTQWRLYSQTRLNKGNADESLWTWNPYIEDDDCSYVTMTAGTFYHFAITVTPHIGDEGWTHDVKVEVTDMDGEPVGITNDFDDEEHESVTLPYTDEGSGAWFKQFACISGRYKSGMKMDNIQVMKKVEADAVPMPTLAMTGVQMEGRIIALDNGMAGEGLTPYYIIVDEETYASAQSSAELNGTPYTAPFVVSEVVNYVLAWNVDEAGKASELYRFTCEAGWAAQLNEPTIKAYDYVGYKKTCTASCYQGDVQPFAPLEYTIYMSGDSVNWEATTSFTVESGKVYAKVEADGYATAACEGVEVPEGAYGSTKWTVDGVVLDAKQVVDDNDAPVYSYGGSRVVMPRYCWDEDCEDYNEEYAWPLLRKNGLHMHGGDGASDKNTLFVMGSGAADNFVVNGISVYSSRNAYFTIDNLHEGDIIQLSYNDGTAKVLTVDDPETFVVPIPQYANYGAGSLSTISIKGEGTVETREVKPGEWGIISSPRTVCDVNRAGATFYEHVYTIYNDETYAADTLLLQPVKELEAGRAYFYQATSDVMELVTLAAEEPVDEQPYEQQEYENYTFYPTVYEPVEDYDLYTMLPSGILMKNEKETTIPMYTGYFQYLDVEEMYAEWLDYKLLDEYNNYIAATEKYISDYENDVQYEYDLDENGEMIWDEYENDYMKHEVEKPELDIEAVYAERYKALLSKYAVIPVKHNYDESLANAIASNTALPAQLVNVVTPAGIVLRRGAKPEDALKDLKRGIYIVGGKKFVK